MSKVVTYALEQPLSTEQQFAFSQSVVRRRSVLICRIETDEGLVGWGEAFGPCRIHKTIIDQYYAPYLLGKDPFDSQVIWEGLYNMLRDNGQKGVTVQSLSAVDIALWDLKGKAVGRPVYQLLGGAFRQRIRPYATGTYRRYTADEITETVAEAVSYADRGFLAIKLKTGFGLDYDTTLVREVRQAVGDDIDLMVDANHGYNAMTAIQVGRALERYRLTWFEEPVPPEDLAGYCEVKAKLDVPIAGGEAEFTRYGVKRLLDRRCVDILQPDCTITGGLSEFRNLAMLATLANVQCFPHVWGSGIALATGMHAAFSLPDFPPGLEPAPVFFEWDQTPNVFREQLAIGLPQLKNGWLERPQAPGLGIEINHDLLQHYAVESAAG